MESQLATIQALLSQRSPCTLPSQTKANPKKGEAKVVSTRSGRPMTEHKKREKALYHTKKKALIEEGQEAKKEGEKGVLTLLRVSIPFS